MLVLASMFLPWYSRDGFAATGGESPKTTSQLISAHDSTMAIGVFSFVEAAIFLVAVGVLVLMFSRGEKKAFHLPGGDGTIVTVAGAWTAFLVFYRFVDQPSGGGSKTIVYDYGLHWGIFFGLLAALFLAYAGNALRAASLAEPPLPGRVVPSSPPPAVAEQQGSVPRTGRSGASRRRRRPSTSTAPPAGGEQLSLEESLAFEDPGPEPDTRFAEPDEQPTHLAEPDEQPTRRATPFERPAAFDEDPPEFPPRR